MATQSEYLVGGLRYTPSFPSMQALFAQQQQQQRAAAIQRAAQLKITEQRNYDTIKNAYKFEADPWIKQYSAYFQTQTADIISMTGKVRSGEIDPLQLEKRMADVQADSKRVKMFSTEMDAWQKQVIASGNYNNDKILEIISKETTDFVSSFENGATTFRPPSELDAQTIQNRVKNSIEAYNPDAMTEKFVNQFKDQKVQSLTMTNTNIPGVGMQVSTTALPSSLTKLNNAGRPVIYVGEPGSDQAKTMLANWEGFNGSDGVNFLNLKAIELYNKEMAGVTDESNKPYDELSIESRGLIKQRALQTIMDEGGFAPSETKKDFRNLPVDQDSTSAGIAKKERETLLDDKAKLIYDLHSGDTENAIRLVKNLQGPRQVATYDPDTNKITITIKGGSSTFNAFNPGEVKDKVEVIDLDKPWESVPLINTYWQGVQGTKSEVDTQELERRLKVMRLDKGIEARKSLRERGKATKSEAGQFGINDAPVKKTEADDFNLN